MFLDRCTDELNISFDFCTFTLSHTHQMKHASIAYTTCQVNMSSYEVI